MTRNEEYKALLAELEQPPAALEGTAKRALKREKTSQKKRRAFGISAVGLAACFTAFILLVNLSVPFARACGTVPVLRELAKAVAWSPSLSAAVENDYVQPIGQSQTANGVTATVEYVIVDQKQLNIFYSLDFRGGGKMSGVYGFAFTPDTHSWTGTAGGMPEESGVLQQISLDFVDTDVPGALDLTLEVYKGDPYQSAPVPVEGDIFDDLLAGGSKVSLTGEPLAAFTFHLEFDPRFTAQGEVIPVDRTFSLDGQSVTVTEAEVYPTHVRVGVEGSGDNTAWLTGLYFYLENEKGERFDPTTNGITAIGRADSPENAAYTLDSPYFANCRELTLYVTGARWLDKDMERVEVDLANGTAERLPEGVTLESADRRSGGWVLTFQAEQRVPGHYEQTWSTIYYDEAGEAYDSGGLSWQQMEDERMIEVHYTLSGYTQDRVWLSSCYSRYTVEDVAIPIK